MAAYLWLIWYDAATKVAPKHWTLAVSYELHDCAYATVYEVSTPRAVSAGILFTTHDYSAQVTMDITGRYQSRVVRRVHLTGNHPSGAYGGKILLGEVNDGVLCALEAYSESAAELVNTHDRKRGAESSNCHDWATIIVRSLEDAMLLPKVCQPL